MTACCSQIPTSKSLVGNSRKSGVRPVPAAFEEAGHHVAAGVTPDGDLHASSEYRQHLAGVLTRRALARATERTGGRGATGERR